MTSPTLSRRRALAWLGASAALPVVAACSGSPAQAKAYPVSYSDAEWRRRLTAEQYAALRRKGTEAPGTSPLLREHRTGTFVCAADGNPLFASSTKYESGTGCPASGVPPGRFQPNPAGVLVVLADLRCPDG